MIQGPIGSYESGQFQFWYSEKQAEGTEVVRANVIWFLDTEKIKKLNNGSLSMQKILCPIKLTTLDHCSNRKHSGFQSLVFLMVFLLSSISQFFPVSICLQPEHMCMSASLNYYLFTLLHFKDSVILFCAIHFLILCRIIFFFYDCLKTCWCCFRANMADWDDEALGQQLLIYKKGTSIGWSQSSLFHSLNTPKSIGPHQLALCILCPVWQK